MSTAPTIETLGNAVLVGYFEDGSPEWHAARVGVIGGSEIASILGRGFNSRFMHWQQKAGFAERPEIDPAFAEWGHRLEPVIAAKFADLHPELRVLEGGTWINKDRPWQSANPDGRLEDATTGEVVSILELKASERGAGWENGRVPLKYIEQLRWYLDTFGFDHGYIAVLIGGFRFEHFRVPANPAFAVVNQSTGERRHYDTGRREMRAAAAEFMASLPTEDNPAGNPPPLDGRADTYEFVRRQHMSIITKGEGAEVELPDDVGEAWMAARAAFAAAEEEKIRMKGHLLAHMGTAKAATYKGAVVAVRQAKKTATGGDGVPFLVEK